MRILFLAAAVSLAALPALAADATFCAPYSREALRIEITSMAADQLATFETGLTLDGVKAALDRHYWHCMNTEADELGLPDVPAATDDFFVSALWSNLQGSMKRVRTPAPEQPIDVATKTGSGFSHFPPHSAGWNAYCRKYHSFDVKSGTVINSTTRKRELCDG